MGEVIGIIGAGTITDTYYIPTLKRLGFSELLVCDSHEQSAASLAVKHSIKATSLNRAISDAQIMVIATPPQSHFDLLKQCISAGNKTIICEKPFLFYKAHALEVSAMAAATSCTVLVAHIRRCFSAIRLAKNTIPQLAMGKLKRARIMEGGRLQYQSRSGYLANNAYGGVLLDTGSHAIDCFLYATGLTKTNMQCTVNTVQKDKTEPAHEVFYSFNLNDLEIELTLSRYRALSNKITLFYENGTVEIPLGLTPNIVITKNNSRKVYSPENGCFTYMSQAFYAELGKLTIEKDRETFGADDFVSLSAILETLYHA